MKNIKNLYNSRDKLIILSNDDAKTESEFTYKRKQRAGLEILTPKQLVKRLPVALAQVKTSNNLENFLNKIKRIVYSLNQ